MALETARPLVLHHASTGNHRQFAVSQMRIFTTLSI